MKKTIIRDEAVLKKIRIREELDVQENPVINVPTGVEDGDAVNYKQLSIAEKKIINLEGSQVSGFITYFSRAELEASVGALNTSYYVTDDDDKENNGYYQFDGTDFIQVDSPNFAEIVEIKDVTTVHPSYTKPTIYGSNKLTLEVGRVYNGYVFTFTKKQNDASSIAIPSFDVDGVEAEGGITETTFTTIFTAGSGESSKVFNMAMAHGASVIKNNNYNEADTTNGFTSGIVTDTTAIDVKYFHYHGAVSAVPASSEAIQALSSTSATSFNLTTGTTQKNFVVCCQQGYSIVSMKDTSASNANYTGDLVETSSAFSTIDNATTYKVYTLTQESSFSSSHTLAITIKKD